MSWFTLETLTQAITRSKVDASTAKVIQRICRAELIVVDNIGVLPAGQAEAEALYRIADAAYERRSLAVTSNIHPSGFDTLMPKALAGPTVDRLLHHGYVVVTEGDSQRLAEALSSKGVGWLKLSSGGLLAATPEVWWPRFRRFRGRQPGVPSDR